MKSFIELYYSKDIIELFQKRRYEEYVLELMQLSQVVFPHTYKKFELQSNGEADYLDLSDGSLYDAKLPFESDQVELLVSGKKHDALVTAWLGELREEASHLDIDGLRAGTYDVKSNRLYSIMYNCILGEMENDENIIFFMPFVIGHNFRGSIISQVSDCLDVIFDSLREENELNYLENREIYVVCPDTKECNSFLLRNLSRRTREYVCYDRLSGFFRVNPVIQSGDI